MLLNFLSDVLCSCGGFGFVANLPQGVDESPQTVILLERGHASDLGLGGELLELDSHTLIERSRRRYSLE